MSRRLKPKPEALAARVASGHVTTNGHHAEPAVERVVIGGDTREALDLLVRTTELLTRIGGYLTHEDQETVRAAKRFLARRR